jgi:tRNA pseudouridine synthase 10
MAETELLKKVLDALRPYEFRTLLLGFERPDDYDRSVHEAAYRELKIQLGTEITRRLEGVEIDFKHPDLRIEIGQHLQVKVVPAPIFLGGRYLKLSRQIPASRWRHHPCRGRGCPDCSYTGTLCGPSVEELLSAPVLEHSGGARVFFHALGREDTDARMLGRGRPFVLEVQSPIRRTLPLEQIAAGILERAGDLAEVRGLTAVDRSAVTAVKGAAAEKSYRAWLHLEGDAPPDAADRARALGGTRIEQLSPRRVMHRRGRDTCRRRTVVDSSWLGKMGDRHVWEVRVESGTYVKELVSGDGGRTRPSLSEVLGRVCRCEELDVLDVHWEAPWEVAREMGEGA